MAKSTSPKTNGHAVEELKAAAPKKAAARVAVKAPAKSAAKAPAGKAVPVKAAAKPAAKVARKPAAKPVPAPAAKTAVKAAAKPTVKPKVKPAVKAAPKAPAKPAAVPAATQAAPEGGAAMAEKSRKARLVRDSFTMPEQEYAVLGQVKKACIKAGFEIKKSELLRIGVALISELDMATLKKVLDSLPHLKTGRPKNT